MYRDGAIGCASETGSNWAVATTGQRRNLGVVCAPQEERPVALNVKAVALRALLPVEARSRLFAARRRGMSP